MQLRFYVAGKRRFHCYIAILLKMAYGEGGKDLLTEFWETMNPSLSRASAHCSLLRAAAILFITTPLFAPIRVLAQSQNAPSPRLPDMSFYDCASITADTAASTRHIGQVIQGLYNEWYEYYTLSQDEPRLACIGLARPTPRQLSGAEAKAFLTNSFAVGAPAASSFDRPQALPGATSPTDIEPDNVQAEPLKGVRRPAPPADGSLPTDPGKAPNTPEQPPLPASKDFEPPGAVVAPAKEHGTSLVTQPAPAAGFEKPATVGVEDRQVIPNTQSFPWNTLAYLSVTYPTNASFRCSATLVSPYVVLTAGHCVHDKTRGGYVTSARVYPGQNQATLGDNTPIRPYGVKSDVQSTQTTLEWTQISGDDKYLVSQYRYDIAAIEFKTPFTHTSTFMPVMYASTGTPVTNAGYPAQIKSTDAFGLYAEAANETDNSFFGLHSSHLREFLIDASGGNSGGPFFYVDPSTGQRYLVGSLSYGDDLNDSAGGPWYDSWNQALISGWASWTPAAAAAGSVTGLRVASIFGSTQPSMESYLRFYNASNSSGTVDVTLADYATGAVLATWTSPSLPSHSSKQFSIDEVEKNANASFTKSLVYSISVRPSFTGSFQNILWRKVDATLSNLSTCETPATDQTTLMNVHSSLLSGYPSAVIIHNTSTTNISLSLAIYHQITGQRLGTYSTGQIPANGQLILSVPTIEAGAGISPSSSSAYHYNIKSNTTFTGYLQHLLNNQAAGVTTDMTEACALVP